MTNPETGYEKAHRQVEQIFRQFFPARGMVTREGQIRLCHMMLDALFGLDVALCDAGVGLGKTYAYLVACVLWQLQRPRQMQRPVVISTAIGHVACSATRRGRCGGRNLDLELGAHKEKTDQDLGNFAKAQCGFDYNRRKSAVSALPVWSGYSAGQAYHEKGG